MNEEFHWVELSPMRHPRRDARACLLSDGSVWLEGGTTWSLERRELVRPGPELYDLKHDRWLDTGAMTAPTAFAAEPRLPAGAKLLHPRERPTLTTVGAGQLLVTGGYQTFSTFGGDDKDDSVEQAELLDLASGVSRPAGVLRHARHAHAALALPGGAALLLGGQHDDGSEATAKVELGFPHGWRPARLFAPEVMVRIDAQLAQQSYQRLLGRVRALPLDERLPLARALAKKFPGEDDAWSALGDALTARRKFDEACDAYTKAVALDSESAFHHYALGAAQQAAGRAKAALASYEKVIALTADDDTWTWQVRKAALAQRQFLKVSSGAAAAFEEEAGQPPQGSDSPSWNNHGAALMGLSRWAQALGAFDRALALDPANSYAWGNRASALLRLKRPAEAVKACRRAIRWSKSEPNRCAGHCLTLGVAEFDRHRYAASVKAYDRSLALSPGDAAWSNRGNSLLRLKRFDDALESYRRAPRFARAWWGRACVHQARGETKLAQHAVDRALELEPSLAAEMSTDEDLRGLRITRR